MFTAVEAVLIASSLGGPTIDEGMYIAAGLRTLGGHGLSDSYLTWFSGSLLWPALAGGAYELSGLEGARLLALACVVGAMIATIKATGNLFGARARFFTALILATSGPVLMLATSRSTTRSPSPGSPRASGVSPSWRGATTAAGSWRPP